MGGSFEKIDETPDEAPEEVLGRRKEKHRTSNTQRRTSKFGCGVWDEEGEARDPAVAAGFGTKLKRRIDEAPAKVPDEVGMKLEGKLGTKFQVIVNPNFSPALETKPPRGTISA